MSKIYRSRAWRTRVIRPRLTSVLERTERDCLVPVGVKGSE
jgi:hypothetical protein